MTGWNLIAGGGVIYKRLQISESFCYLHFDLESLTLFLYFTEIMFTALITCNLNLLIHVCAVFASELDELVNNFNGIIFLLQFKSAVYVYTRVGVEGRFRNLF